MKRFKVIPGNKNQQKTNDYGVNYDNYRIVKEFYDIKLIVYNRKELLELNEFIKLGGGFNVEKFIRLERTIEAYLDEDTEESKEILSFIENECKDLYNAYNTIVERLNTSQEIFEEQLDKENFEKANKLREMSPDKFRKSDANLRSKFKTKISHIESLTTKFLLGGFTGSSIAVGAKVLLKIISKLV